MHGTSTIIIPLSAGDRAGLSFLRGIFSDGLHPADAETVFDSIRTSTGLHLVAIRSNETGACSIAVKVGNRVHAIESESEFVAFLFAPDAYPPANIVLHLGDPIANLTAESPHVFSQDLIPLTDQCRCQCARRKASGGDLGLHRSPATSDCPAEGSDPVTAVVVYDREPEETYEGRGKKPGYWYVRHVECESRPLSESEEDSAIQTAWQHVGEPSHCQTIMGRRTRSAPSTRGENSATARRSAQGGPYLLA